MPQTNTHVCPAALAGSLDNSLRKMVHNPKKILIDYIKGGMVVLDVGCGPGLFSREIARMVGEDGKVIAADLQKGMLETLANKIKGSEIEKRIILHQCASDKIGVSEAVDFVLAFYMVHEVPNQLGFFQELNSILKPQGEILLVEPMFHVSKSAFERTVDLACQTGLKVLKKEKVFFSRAVVLGK